MDKYEYNIKADQIIKLIDRRDFKTAAKIADGIDWRRVRNINMLTNVGCVYQAVGRYADAKEIFQLARNRAPLGRRLVYQMADVCIDAGEFEEAERYIQEFSELAPKDTARFELLYQLSRRKGEPIENQIAILEELKNQDLDERWSFELAKLYHKAGYNQKCVDACDELILWFGEGQYVDKAMELKMLHAPLSAIQQEKYNMHLKKKQEAENPPVKKEAKEETTVSGSQKKHSDRMYATDNLQAALTKSVQEIMEAEERRRASYPSERSYFEEYQSEQEERDAMFAATRDLRREREKFKNMMTQPISSLITERNTGNMAKDSLMQDMSVQQYSNSAEEKNYEQAEEETRRVFGAAENAFGGLEEVRASFGISNEEIGHAPMGWNREAEAVFGTETEKRTESESASAAVKEESGTLFDISRKRTGKTSGNTWEETGSVFGAVRREKPLQTSDVYSNDSEIKEKELFSPKEDFKLQTGIQEQKEEIEQEAFEGEMQTQPTELISDILQKGLEETEEWVNKEAEEDLEGESEKEEVLEDTEEDLEEEKVLKDTKEDWKEEEVLKDTEKDLEEGEVLEDIEEDLEEEEVFEDTEEDLEKEEAFEDTEEDIGFSDGDFFGGEFYYQVPGMSEKEEPSYIEKPFSFDQLDTNEVPANVYYRIPDYDPQPFLNKMAVRREEDEETKTTEESDRQKQEHIVRTEQEELEENRAIEETTFGAEELEEMPKPFEPGEAVQEEPEEEDLAYEDFPEGGTREEFYQYIMTRSYGVEEMPEDVSYQAEGYKEGYSKEEEKEKQVSSEEDFGYVYGTEMMPEDAYYEAAGYNPENFLLARMGNQGLEEEIFGKKPQTKVLNKVPRKRGTQQKSENGLEKNLRAESEVQPESQLENKPEVKKKAGQQKKHEPQQEKQKTQPLELTEEWKNIFVNYLYMPGVEQQIAEILYETERIGEEAKTSMFGNVLLMGEVKSGKTTLAVSLIKTMNRINARKGRKIAKISGDRLNNKGIKESISRLTGADLIIEHAGEMRISTITELLEAMGDYTGGMIVVLEDTKTSIERLLADVPQIAVCFTHRIELKECNIAEWAEAARNYALENHYVVDDMAMLALSAKIDGVYANKKNIVMEDVQDIMDDAIEKAERRNKKLFGRLFSKKKDSDAVVLRESDFS